MKLGLHSAILVDYPFEEMLKIAHSLGYSAIECCCWPLEPATRRYSGITHIDVDCLTTEKIAEIHQLCAQYDIEIATLGYYPNTLSTNEAESQKAITHLLKVIEAAAKLGINKVSTFIGKDKNKSVEENLEIFAHVWPAIIKHAEEYKVRVAIENCPMYFSKDEWPGGANLASAPYVWREMFRIIDSPYFGLTYDPSHSFLQGMSVTKPIYEFKEKIFHVHLKDLRIYQDKLDEYGTFAYPLSYMAPKIPGHGQINWGEVISALNDIKYCKPVVIEVEDKSFESCPEDIIKACELSYIHCNQYVK